MGLHKSFSKEVRDNGGSQLAENRFHGHDIEPDSLMYVLELHYQGVKMPFA